MSYALLGSYVIQSQFGDYDPTEHGVGTRYISHMTLAPEQSEELLEKVTELHKTHRFLIDTLLRKLLNSGCMNKEFFFHIHFPLDNVPI